MEWKSVENRVLVWKKIGKRLKDLEPSEKLMWDNTKVQQLKNVRKYLRVCTKTNFHEMT